MQDIRTTLTYNTQRGHMYIPEYGRNVQNMIAFAKGIKDREERNRAARAIIDVMGQLNPHLRDVEDYAHKLWTHLFVMSNFDFDVDSPYPIPEKESLTKRPDDMEYPKNEAKFGHFGYYTEEIIRTVSEIDDPKEKEFMTEVIGNLMKKNYILFHTGNVENEAIADYLAQISKGKLSLADAEILKPTKQILRELGVNPNSIGKIPKKTKTKKRRR
jgi:hypothetical protein